MQIPKCLKCGLSEHMEEWGESGEFWWHCHKCDLDDADVYSGITEAVDLWRGDKNGN